MNRITFSLHPPITASIVEITPSDLLTRAVLSLEAGTIETGGSTAVTEALVSVVGEVATT